MTEKAKWIKTKSDEAEKEKQQALMLRKSIDERELMLKEKENELSILYLLFILYSSTKAI